EAAYDQHRVVRERNRRGIPAGVLLVGGLRWLRALLVPRIAVLIERRVRIAGEQLLAKRIPLPIRQRAGLPARSPGFCLRVEYLHFVQSVVALHVVAAEDVDTSVGESHARVAIGVVEHTLR